MPDDDLHPYYKRKAEKNAETVDFVVRNWHWMLLAAIIIGVVSHAVG